MFKKIGVTMAAIAFRGNVERPVQQIQNLVDRQERLRSTGLPLAQYSVTILPNRPDNAVGISPSAATEIQTLQKPGPRV
jgi:hypothetical protein